VFYFSVGDRQVFQDEDENFTGQSLQSPVNREPVDGDHTTNTCTVSTAIVGVRDLGMKPERKSRHRDAAAKSIKTAVKRKQENQM
jgi:hypothetical protein